MDIYKFIKIYRRIPKSKWGKKAFYKTLPKNSCVLDIGCGNNSAKEAKLLRPDIFYAGIDIDDYNNSQESISLSDVYVKVKSGLFPEGISSVCGADLFDAVISSHNLEHCERPSDTLVSMCKKLKYEGMLFLSFPCEESVDFPHRKGTLNFYDDKTHVKPPVFKEVISILCEHGMEIIYAQKRYRPPVLWIMGGVQELISRKKNKIMRGTWAFWGFESVIWAKKIV